ncbi:hypothetical protein Bbelb_218410 [Branchiostoma belcheri]|nr:hypothetical protein Bbelb_218410 [Branchiostoma belcheri]
MGQSGSTECEVAKLNVSRPTPTPKPTIPRETYPTYTRAIVRGIPNSIRDRSEARLQGGIDCCSLFLGFYGGHYNYDDIPEWVEVGKARRQHARYIRVLRDLGLEVTVLPADESTPDCPFVEDTCVVVGNRALVTRPEGMVRRRELASVETCLRSLGLEVHKISSSGATLEGGDVVFTGTEFFVGDSSQSNLAGHRILAETFPEYPVHSVPLYPPEFHLKGVACCAAPGVIALADNSAGRLAWDVICRKGISSYQPLWLPDCSAVDCIYVNGTLIHCSWEEGRSNCQVFAQNLPDCNLVKVPLDELGKVQAALSCCSVLF